jgi:5-methylcytosine-specific restriction endonuclease McrA
MTVLRKPNREARLERRASRMKNRLTSGERRALARGVLVEKVSRKKLLKLYKGKCGICQQRVNPRKFEIDHIIPLCKGGTHEYRNVQPAHPECNRLKADKLPGEVIVPWRKKSKKSKGYINPPRAARATT